MKSESSVQKSADAALKQAMQKCRELHELLKVIKAGNSPEIRMPRIRAAIAELTQRVHEFNAYSNVILTE